VRSSGGTFRRHGFGAESIRYFMGGAGKSNRDALITRKTRQESVRNRGENPIREDGGVSHDYGMIRLVRAANTDANERKDKFTLIVGDGGSQVGFNRGSGDKPMVEYGNQIVRSVFRRLVIRGD
jgi:hypothetical protein